MPAKDRKGDLKRLGGIFLPRFFDTAGTLPASSFFFLWGPFVPLAKGKKKLHELSSSSFSNRRLPSKAKARRRQFTFDDNLSSSSYFFVRAAGHAASFVFPQKMVEKRKKKKSREKKRKKKNGLPSPGAPEGTRRRHKDWCSAVSGQNKDIMMV